MHQYIFSGVTNEYTTCDLCGRTDLKRTVTLNEVESGMELHFGTVCAANALNWPVERAKKRISKEWVTLDSTRMRRIQQAQYALKQPWGGYFQAAFRSLHERGLVQQGGHQLWQLQSGMPFSDYVKFNQADYGFAFSFPGNFYVYNDFCSEALLSSSPQFPATLVEV